MLKNVLTTAAVVAMLTLGAASASAQTTTDTGSTTGTYPATPGTPNTGAGGAAAQNILLLVGSALAVVGGTAYLARRTGVRS